MASRKFVTKSEYSKKLLDPRWQKLRLEVLASSDWKCAWCGNGLSDGETLHVHHRQYFKGREPWEYEPGQLEVLCKGCHQDEHEKDDALLIVCSHVGRSLAVDRSFVASLILGLCGLDLKNAISVDPDAMLIGKIAANIPVSRDKFTIEDLARIAEAARRNPMALAAALVEFADRELGGLK